MPYLYNIWSFDQEIEFRPFLADDSNVRYCAPSWPAYISDYAWPHALREGRRGESLGFGVNFSFIWHGIGSWVGHTLIQNQKNKKFIASIF